MPARGFRQLVPDDTQNTQNQDSDNTGLWGLAGLLGLLGLAGLKRRKDTDVAVGAPPRLAGRTPLGSKPTGFTAEVPRH
ncbi:MAG: hypothetical protein QOD88_1573 [Mycobacterium sp.]|jgi:LPXTG-motif cell wall-anchored protein|nr:hypothetical protein [Mycobacterium sp.]